MPSLLYQTIDQLSRDKGIDPEIIVSAVEDALLVATRKYYKTSEELRSHLDRESGKIEVYAVHKVVEEVTDPVHEITLAEAQKYDPNAQIDGEIKIPKPTDVLGRIAAQTAKQVIFQKVREAERETTYNEFSQRIGELANAIVKRTEGPDVIVELENTEARLPRREQSRLESYNMGDRVRVIIKQVDKAARGQQVIVSRADPLVVQKLFAMEVPEIYDGTVQIKACAREAGERTKVAVASKDRDVDAVGACVGMKGMRVQSIIRELRGEKIDIIEFSDDTSGFAINSLSPAKISRVQIIDPAEKHLEVIVEDSQLALAIGKKGQNVRLASKLIGWRIDIKSEEEKRREVEVQMEEMMTTGTSLEELVGIGEKTRLKLENTGLTTIERLAEATPEQLMEIQGIGEKMVEKIRLSVTNYFEAQEAAELAAQAEEAVEAPAEAVAEQVPVAQAEEPVTPETAAEVSVYVAESKAGAAEETVSAEVSEEPVEAQAENVGSAEATPVEESSETDKGENEEGK